MGSDRHRHDPPFWAFHCQLFGIPTLIFFGVFLFVLPAEPRQVFLGETGCLQVLIVAGGTLLTSVSGLLSLCFREPWRLRTLLTLALAWAAAAGCILS